MLVDSEGIAGCFYSSGGTFDIGKILWFEKFNVFVSLSRKYM